MTLTFDDLDKLGIRSLRKIAKEKNIPTSEYTSKKNIIDKILEKQKILISNQFENLLFPTKDLIGLDNEQISKLEDIDELYNFDIFDYSEDFFSNEYSKLQDDILINELYYGYAVCVDIDKDFYYFTMYESNKVYNLQLNHYLGEKFKLVKGDGIFCSYLKNTETQTAFIKSIYFKNDKLFSDRVIDFYENFPYIKKLSNYNFVSNKSKKFEINTDEIHYKVNNINGLKLTLLSILESTSVSDINFILSIEDDNFKEEFNKFKNIIVLPNINNEFEILRAIYAMLLNIKRRLELGETINLIINNTKSLNEIIIKSGKINNLNEEKLQNLTTRFFDNLLDLKIKNDFNNQIKYFCIENDI